MSTRSGYAPNEYGWGTMSEDYCAHLSKLQRMPTVLNEVPQYPSVHKAFKNKYTYVEEQEPQQKKSPPEAQKKVQMREHVEIVGSSNKQQYAPNEQQNGWGTTSEDYHGHISKTQRTPTVVNEVPHYPSVHKAFNNKYTHAEEQETQQEQQKKKSPAKAQKKVQMSEHVEIVESSNNDENREVHEQSIDVKADGFIQRKRRGFQLFKLN